MIRIKSIILFLCFIALSSCESDVVDDLERYEFGGRYAALGDSITYGKGSDVHRSWADIIQDHLGVLYFEKKAVNGAVASSRLPEEDYNLSSQVDKLDGNYDLITLMIGINDCLLGYGIGDVKYEIGLPMEDLNFRESFSQGFIYNIRLLQDRYPNATIIVITPPAIAYKTKQDLIDYINAERLVCARLQIPYIDLSGSQYNPDNTALCEDRIHPTDKGYYLIAKYILPRIAAILGL